MLTVTYLVTVYNKERYLSGVINSLKATTGNFLKEYVFINDGSTDNSTKILEEQTRELQNAKIINQSNQGPSISTNNGLKIASGDYVHFVDGDDIIAPDSTSKLLNSVKAFDCDVAFSNMGLYNYKTLDKKDIKSKSDFLFIEDPIRELLNGKIKHIRKIGSSGSLVSLKLLKKIGGCDTSVFIQDFSLALRCANVRKFIKLTQSLYYCPEVYDSNNLSFNRHFEIHQSLLTLENFIKENHDFCAQYNIEFYRALFSALWKKNKSIKNNGVILIKYLASKLMSAQFVKLDPQSLLDLYRMELEKIKPQP
jgi:glycosyltransferase involved in cell wall biosynthesis